MLTFKTKLDHMIPLICSFDMYFDLKSGIQFLCLTQQPATISIDGQNINQNDVYMIQTTGYFIVQGLSHNMARRLGISTLKVYEERLDIGTINESLSDLSEGKYESGAPALLNFSCFHNMQDENSKDKMEQYKQKLANKSTSFNTNGQNNEIDSFWQKNSGLNQLRRE